jgi:copper chaperone CopZ
VIEAGLHYLIKSVDGVIEVNTDYEKHTATVTYDEEKTKVETMKEDLEKTNDPVSVDAGQARKLSLTAVVLPALSDAILGSYP